MRLEIGNFYVKDIVFGNELSYEDGILTIEKEAALNYIRQDKEEAVLIRIKKRKSNKGNGL